MSSAEWVEEAPTAGRREETLDQFGSVQFQNATTVMDGKQVSIAQEDAEPITMVSSTGQPIATPSALGGDSSSFRVTHLTSSSSAPSPAIPGSGRSTP
ncbi:MAG: G1 family glutamic endopeptidase [Dehalococcoidia bacterium]